LAAILQAGCACVFVGPVTKCVLAAFPYTCTSWFTMYRGAFMLAFRIWKGIEKISKNCMTPIFYA
jgi:hypothetical protein